MQSNITLKSFWKPWSLFSQSEFPKKGENLPKLDWSRDATGRVNIILFFFSRAFRLREQMKSFQKHLTENISVYSFNIFAVAGLKWHKKIQKSYFNFSYFKQLDTLDCFWNTKQHNS